MAFLKSGRLWGSQIKIYIYLAIHANRITAVVMKPWPYCRLMKGTWWRLEIYKSIVPGCSWICGFIRTCAFVSVIEFFPLSFQCGRPLFFSTVSECYTFCFHSYLASQGSLGPLCWSAVSPVLRVQGSRHFPIFKPAAVREHMSNSWMTHVTSAEAGCTSEELQLDSEWVSETTKHNPQE